MTAGDELISRTSVVIPVKDDPLIFRCLESIDERVEVVVVTNGSTPAFVRWVASFDRFPLEILSLEEAGIGAAFNAGAEKASGDFVLLMDSDCVFTPGSIRAMAAGLGTGSFSRGRTVFSSHNWATRMTARTREYTEDALRTRRPNAYSPPLLYRKDVIRHMGGYHFDTRLTWREDRDFELRRRAAGLPVAFVPEGTVIHKPLTIRADLASVRNYGAGQHRGECLGILPESSARHEWAKTLRAVARIAAGTRNPLPAVYPVVRRLAFIHGYRTAARSCAPARPGTGEPS
ncbi:glycosyltransferase family A protein [Streptomyces sp. NPDC006458]|uniref:glycosyltransferase family 2 protein n=1 Tax=Streptomyces sp. NPDC006458 TaxID=3154302 RepID=UPI0033B46835